MCQSYLIKDKLDKGMLLQKNKTELFWSTVILVKRTSKTLLKATPIFLLPSWIQLGQLLTKETTTN